MVYVNWVVKIYEKVRIGDVYYPLYHIANLFTIPLALTNLLSIYAASNMWDWTQCLYVMYLTYETKQTRRKSRRRVVQFRSQFVHPENVMKLMIRTDHLTFRDLPPLFPSQIFSTEPKKNPIISFDMKYQYFFYVTKFLDENCRVSLIFWGHVSGLYSFLL